MIQILVIVGKGIGIALVCVLILVLVFLAAILFVPVRYRVFAVRKDGEMPCAVGKVSWFFSIIMIKVQWKDKLHSQLKILGIPFYDNLRKAAKEKKAANGKKSRKKKKVKKAKKAKEAKKISEDIKKEEHTGDTEYSHNTYRAEKTEASENVSGSKDSGKEKKATLLAKIKEFFHFLKKLIQKIAAIPQNIHEKIQHIKETAEFWKEFLEREEFKRVFSRCRRQLFKIWRNVRPKIKAQFHFGFADPSTTGNILGIAGMLYPVIGNHIYLRPEFEEEILEGELLIKGRITLFVFIKALWVLYFDRDLRRLRRVWKEKGGSKS